MTELMGDQEDNKRASEDPEPIPINGVKEDGKEIYL